MEIYKVKIDDEDEEELVMAADPTSAAESYSERLDMRRCEYPFSKIIQVLDDDSWIKYEVELESCPTYHARRIA